MKTGNKKVNVFKIRNRRGFAAVCAGCLTEGNTPQAALARMAKALKRVKRKKSR